MQRPRRYDAGFDQPGPAGYSLRTRLAATLRLVPDEPGDVLDAGMGPGRLCVELDQRGWRVSGVDVSEVMVELAAARLPHARERLLAAPIEALPFPDESFDVVIATGVLEHVGDKEAAIRELARVLRPGGRAIVSFPNPHAFYFWWKSGVSYRLSTILKRRVKTVAGTASGSRRRTADRGREDAGPRRHGSARQDSRWITRNPSRSSLYRARSTRGFPSSVRASEPRWSGGEQARAGLRPKR